MTRRILSLGAIGIAIAGFAIFLIRCPKPTPVLPIDAGSGTALTISNDTPQDAIVYIAFGADSVVLPSSWPLCNADSGLTCNFPIKARSQISLPLASRYLNATVSFDKPVGCGSTKAELNLNNPKWYNTLDVSLVDGFSNGIAITIAESDAGIVKLGPPNGPKDNEKLFGLFPLGCDICTARQSPPCGIVPGGTGCKAGTQYAPLPPCQYQGATMGGGNAQVTVALVGIPLK